MRALREQTLLPLFRCGTLITFVQLLGWPRRKDLMLSSLSLGPSVVRRACLPKLTQALQSLLWTQRNSLITSQWIQCHLLCQREQRKHKNATKLCSIMRWTANAICKHQLPSISSRDNPHDPDVARPHFDDFRSMFTYSNYKMISSASVHVSAQTFARNEFFYLFREFN